MGAAYARTTLVINDKEYEKYFSNKQAYEINNFTGIKLENPLECEELYNELDKMLPSERHIKSYLEYHQVLFSMYGAYIFIGLFLGILFLMPFLVAMLHTVVILKTYENMVYTIAEDTPVLLYATMVIGIFSIIYGMFYGFIIKGYMKTVWQSDDTV